MLTIAEDTFMKRMPSAVLDLVKAVEELTKEVKELEEVLKKQKEEE